MTMIIFNLSPAPFPLQPPSFGPSGKFLESFQQSTGRPRPPPPLKPKGFIDIPSAPSAPPLSPSNYFYLGPSARSISPARRPLNQQHHHFHHHQHLHLQIIYVVLKHKH